VLVVGPTGSGKSTTLYAGLQVLAADPTRKVITVEDPIEYAIHGVQQTQVKPEIGFAFANAMRAFVREDPDVILVGEIRDRETAQEAIRASQTGHLVLSTLHRTRSRASSAPWWRSDWRGGSATRAAGRPRRTRRSWPRCSPRGSPLASAASLGAGVRRVQGSACAVVWRPSSSSP
jgi:stage III sporulation protein SpoIIIAA